MAEMTIRLTVNPDTGKKDITIKLSSDSDSLPHEHEIMHKQLVDQLIEGGVLTAAEAGKLIVEREEDASIPATPVSQAQPAEGQSHKN